MSISRFGQGEALDDWSQHIHVIMDEMLSRSFVGFRDTRTWQPAANVYETRTHFYICVELAGVDDDCVVIECLDETRILIKGVRAQPHPQGVAPPFSVHALEIDEGDFRREIDLPEKVNPQLIETNYSKGYLWITIPRTNPT